MMEDGCDIGTVQELLGHNDVRATMIYAYVLYPAAYPAAYPAT